MKFLFVDDDTTLLHFLKLTVSHAYKYSEIKTSKNNRAAFKCLDNFIPSLIITDIIRPNGDGYEFLAKLRNDPRLRSIPVICLSGSSQKEENELRQYRHGFNAVIPKPCNLKVIIETINKLLNLHKDPDSVLINLNIESPSLDYKGTLDFKDKSTRASLAKDVIAFANYGGGTIIVGVEEICPGRFDPVGVDESDLQYYEVSRLNRAVRDYIDPPIHIKSRFVSDNGKTFVFIEVPTVNKVFALAKKSHQKAGLFQGRIYSRNTAAETAEIQSSVELREILLRIMGG